MIDYYDVLFYDEEGATRYYDFVKKHAQGSALIELACGTGDMLQRLSPDFDVTGIDINESMIEQANEKYPELEGSFKVGDFFNYRDNKRYDTAICIGDSTNYILTKEDLEAFVETMCSLSNHLILDCHHPERLKEFADDYYEEGSTDSFDYAYQIEVDGEHLVHVINFLDGTFDSIYQWVFDPHLLIDMLKKRGYRVDVYTDHETKGFAKTGEKIVLVAHKES